MPQICKWAQSNDCGMHYNAKSILKAHPSSLHPCSTALRIQGRVASTTRSSYKFSSRTKYQLNVATSYSKRRREPNISQLQVNQKSGNSDESSHNVTLQSKFYSYDNETVHYFTPSCTPHADYFPCTRKASTSATRTRQDNEKRQTHSSTVVSLK
ncbi:hypothetical protein BDR06DRAFT_540899 [Suillus hirtellus]|nr:hypothetical protein BDR06DRAFT_540899 [Suillus hirtellus]